MKAIAKRRRSDGSRRITLVVSVLAAIAYLAFPLGHDTTTGSAGYIPAGRVDRFKEGEPVKVDLLADKIDAWNRVEQVKIGSAWVVNTGGK